jgi:hypothetical protein
LTEDDDADSGSEIGIVFGLPAASGILRGPGSERGGICLNLPFPHVKLTIEMFRPGGSMATHNV